MSEGELKKRIQYCLDEHYSIEGCANCWFQDIEEAKKAIPKQYIYTDYTHDFGDPLSLEYEEPLPEDYPKYVHIPTNEDWLKWFEEWFGEVISKRKI